MSDLEFKIRDYLQQSSTSCLAAAVLIVLNYLDKKEWPLNKEREDHVLENIKFSPEDNYGCHPKAIGFMAGQGYEVLYLLGSVPEERHSPSRDVYDTWIKWYNRIKCLDNVTVKNPEFQDFLPEVDMMLDEGMPVIYYSHLLWHNLIIYGKPDSDNYYVFDPGKGRKLYYSNNLRKHLNSPWGINAIGVKRGKKRTGAE